MKKIIFLAITATIIVYACTSVPITGRRQLNLVSDGEVLSLSLQEYDSYIKSSKKSTDKTATALVEKVGKNIANAVQLYYKSNNAEELLNDYSWEFNLIEDAQVNAFCMPGGKIAVYTGILPVTQDETGLAVVIGHEVAHAIAKHTNERMSQQMVAQYGTEIVNSATKSKLVQQAFGIGSQVGLLKYNRTQESEADHLGLIFMAIAGYDPQFAVPFWQRMSQNNGNQTIQLLSTHPSDATRIAQIQKELPEALEVYKGVWGSYPSGTTAPKIIPSDNTPDKSNTNEQWHF
ncbi:MAG: M48 family metallopeptidase [Dysgonamonadaceae bacterium]|jgi:predicted Zn-dependent protease|nr:M48 family metallopeptidase [Dysgonamonadaceae bacterium]